MDGGESKWEELHTLVSDSGIADQVQGLRGEDWQQRLVVDRQEELKALEKVSTLVGCPCCGQCLTFNGGISLLSSTAEPAPNKDSLPAIGAATWNTF